LYSLSDDQDFIWTMRGLTAIVVACYVWLTVSIIRYEFQKAQPTDRAEIVHVASPPRNNTADR